MLAGDARAVLREFFPPTRLVLSEALSRIIGGEVYLKLESELPTGSFKVRGALFSLSQRIQRETVTEVVAASTGNHGSAVAFAASALGRRATIFLPEKANPVKRSWIESFGAQIIENGRDLSAARAAAEAYALQNRAFLLDDAEDPDIPRGAATIAVEIDAELADVDEIFVPVGDSALIRGVGSAMRTLQPRTRITGVQAEKAPAYYLSWQAGRVVTTDECDTIADGLATRTPRAENVAALRECMDDMQLVSEEQLLQAVQLLAREGVVAEPSGVASVAALTDQRERLAGRRVVALITGGNLDPLMMVRLPIPVRLEDVKSNHQEHTMKITVETVVNGRLNQVWDAWNNPADIKQWNTAQDDWHTTRSTVDLREGGKFMSRMEARDGSAGFDFEGTYTRIVPHKTIEYRMSDGREVKVEFAERADSVVVKETFDTETENPPELQRQGWQAILDNFARHVEAKG